MCVCDMCVTCVCVTCVCDMCVWHVCVCDMCVCAEKGQLSRFRKVQGMRHGYARDHGGPARTLHFQPHHTRILLCLCLWTRRRGCASSGRTRRARSLGGSRRWSRLCHLCCSTLWGTGHGHLGTGHGAQAEGGGQWLEQVSYTHENTRTRIHTHTHVTHIHTHMSHTHAHMSHTCHTHTHIHTHTHVTHIHTHMSHTHAHTHTHTHRTRPCMQGRASPHELALLSQVRHPEPSRPGFIRLSLHRRSHRGTSRSEGHFLSGDR